MEPPGIAERDFLRMVRAKPFLANCHQLANINDELSWETVSEVSSFLRDDLQTIYQSYASYEAGPRLLGAYRIRIVSFPTVLFHEMRNRKYDYRFFWTYIGFVGDSLPTRTLIAELKAQCLQPRFLPFWEINQTRFFIFLEKRYRYNLFGSEVVEFLSLLTRSHPTYSFTHAGHHFIRQRIRATSSLLSKTALGILLDRSKDRRLDVNWLVWEIHKSTDPDEVTLRIECAALFSFLLRDQERVPVSGINRFVSSFAKPIVSKFIGDKLLTPLSGCFQWKRFNKNELIDFLMEQDLNKEAIREFFKNVWRAVDENWQLDVKRAQEINAFFQKHIKLFDLLEIYDHLFFYRHYDVGVDQETAHEVEERFFVERSEDRVLRSFPSADVKAIKLAIKCLQMEGVPIKAPQAFIERNPSNPELQKTIFGVEKSKSNPELGEFLV